MDHDYDPRLVELYDQDNPPGDDHDLYRGIAAAAGAAHIVDIGCGTGSLTVTLAGHGRTVMGMDPSAAMLAAARARPGADAVTWVQGDTTVLTTTGFDLAVMSGNVVQHIAGHGWRKTLAALRYALEPGALLAFDNRNPAARAWEQWRDWGVSTRPTPHGELTEWVDVPDPDDTGTVDLTWHNRFEATGEEVVQSEPLTFRGADRVTADLDEAGFDVEDLWGDWHRRPFAPDDAFMVVLARRR